VAIEVVVFFAWGAAGAAAAGAAAAGAGVALVVVVDDGVAAAADFAGAELLYQSLTPPCPAHAPRLVSADVKVPSLHVPVDPLGACALLVMATSIAAMSVAKVIKNFMCFTPIIKWLRRHVARGPKIPQSRSSRPYPFASFA
jgi:hypothetical protein